MYSRESASSQRIIAPVSLACSSVSSCLPVHPEPFAKFASRWDLLPGRVVIPGSAGVPPAQDLAGSWRLASQGWSVHLPTGAGAAPLQECGRDARAPRGKPMAGQVQIRILQKALLSIHFFINIDAQDFFRKLPASIPEHPQIRTRSSPKSASRAATSRPGYPAHPVHRCSIFGPSRLICPVAGVRWA